MNDPSPWQQFFDSHAPQYLTNGFTANTRAEIDFLLEVMSLASGAHLLDVGCGVGRHSLELARRGFQVTGLDISPGMLDQGRQAAAGESLAVHWVQGDASRTLPAGPFDAVFSLCEGAFSLLSTNDDPLDHDRAILRNIHQALRPGGPLLLNCINAMRHLRMYSPADVAAGKYCPLHLTEHYEMKSETPAGPRSHAVRERGYVPTELRLLLETHGFHVEAIWGGTAGMPFRRAPELDEMELMALARKL